MIITVDPSQSEDIAAFAMVKQYRMQALNVTLNGGTGASAWQAVQGGEGYTQTVVTPVTGIELVYEDPNAIVSYTVENDDTSNYDVASNAGIILSSIVPTDNAWTYTCVFHADSVPVSSVDIDLLVYGNTARGTEQSGSSATAEEITAQVLAGLETRVTALETEMPDKADKATTLAGYGITDAYTKTEADTLLGAKADQATTYTKTEVQTYVSDALDGYTPMVRTANNQTIAGVKTFTGQIWAQNTVRCAPVADIRRGVVTLASNSTTEMYFIGNYSDTGDFQIATYQPSYKILLDMTNEGAIIAPNQRAYSAGNTTDVATIGTLDAYSPMVRTSGNQTIAGNKEFTDEVKAFTPYIVPSYRVPTSPTGTRVNWYKVISFKYQPYVFYEVDIYGQHNNASLEIAKAYFTVRNTTEMAGGFVYNKKNNNGRIIRAMVTTDGTTTDLWLLEGQYVSYRAYLNRSMYYAQPVKLTDITVPTTAITSTDPSTVTGVTASVTLSIIDDAI